MDNTEQNQKHSLSAEDSPTSATDTSKHRRLEQNQVQSKSKKLENEDGKKTTSRASITSARNASRWRQTKTDEHMRQQLVDEELSRLIRSPPLLPHDDWGDLAHDFNDQLIAFGEQRINSTIQPADTAIAAVTALQQCYDEGYSKTDSGAVSVTTKVNEFGQGSDNDKHLHQPSLAATPIGKQPSTVYDEPPIPKGMLVAHTETDQKQTTSSSSLMSPKTTPQDFSSSQSSTPNRSTDCIMSAPSTAQPENDWIPSTSTSTSTATSTSKPTSMLTSASSPSSESPLQHKPPVTVPTAISSSDTPMKAPTGVSRASRADKKTNPSDMGPPSQSQKTKCYGSIAEMHRDRMDTANKQQLGFTSIDWESASKMFRALTHSAQNVSREYLDDLGIDEITPLVTLKSPDSHLSALYDQVLATGDKSLGFKTAAAALTQEGAKCNGNFVDALVGAWLTRDIFEKRSPLETVEELLGDLGDHAPVLQILYQDVHHASLKDFWQRAMFEGIVNGDYDDRLMDVAKKLADDFVSVIEPHITNLLKSQDRLKTKARRRRAANATNQFTRGCHKVAFNALKLHAKTCASAFHDYKVTWIARGTMQHTSTMMSCYTHPDNFEDKGLRAHFCTFPCIERTYKDHESGKPTKQPIWRAQIYFEEEL